MSTHAYLDDDAPPEHVHQAALIRALLNRVSALEAKLDRLEKRVKGNEAAAPI